MILAENKPTAISALNRLADGMTVQAQLARLARLARLAQLAEMQ